MNTARSARTVVSPDTLVQLPALTRREQLRLELLTTVDSLHRRRAVLVSEGFVEDHVALRWLEGRGGAPRLAEAGSDMCDEVRIRLT